MTSRKPPHMNGSDAQDKTGSTENADKRQLETDTLEKIAGGGDPNLGEGNAP